MIGFLCFGLLRLAGSEKVRSLTTPASLIKQFRQYDKIVQKERKYFKPREITAQLYNPNINPAPPLFKKESPSVSLEELKEIHLKNRVRLMDAELGESIIDNLKDKPKEYTKRETKNLNKPESKTVNLPSSQHKEGSGSFSREGNQLIDNMRTGLMAFLEQYKEMLLKEFEFSMRNGVNKTIYDERVEEISRDYRDLLQKKSDCFLS